jgi:AraC-like DNA-binding protein
MVRDMYHPKGSCKEKAASSVEFVEVEPPAHLRRVVSKFLELKTNGTLLEDYRFHALPDACTYIVFDQVDPRITAVTRLYSTSVEFNLGKSFHFVNIRFMPGAWQSGLETIKYGVVDTPYEGGLPLIAINQELQGLHFKDQQPVLVRLVERLLDEKFISANPATEKIFNHIDDVNSVADMSSILNLSPRQLQRVLKRTTGFAPHDFLKILRLQKALIENDTSSYADQSHFIHSFRRATGYTPAKYTQKFDV